MTIADLRVWCPEVNISVTREIDDFAVWDEKELGEKPDDCQPYVFTVTARTIRNGEMLTGESTLSESWCTPDEPIDDVHGYLPQMIDEALGELDKKVSEVTK